MTVFERFYDWLKDILSDVWGAEAPALTAWLEQFASDEGKIVLASAGQYGPLVFTGQMTILDALARLEGDLVAHGIQDVLALREVILNALRTHTNLAAATGQ